MFKFNFKDNNNKLSLCLYYNYMGTSCSLLMFKTDVYIVKLEVKDLTNYKLPITIYPKSKKIFNNRSDIIKYIETNTNYKYIGVLK